MQELKGTTISNHYRLEEIIGEGGMSVVFKATDLYTEKKAAVKVLKKEITSSRIEDIFRFRREATLVSEMSHPNLVQIYEVGQHRDIHYIAMELLAGTSLAQFLKGKGFIDLPLALSIITQLAQALKHVHAAGVVHRDIKPGNIMLINDSNSHPASGSSVDDTKAPAAARDDFDPARPQRQTGDDLTVKMLDFGLSQVLELRRLQTQDAVVGTYSYMSPEQTGIIARPIDERSDLYSLGIVAYELLTGELPFKGTNIGAIVHQQIARDPVAPGRIRGDLPPLVEKMVLKLIKKEPAERYQTAHGLQQDLSRYASGQAPVTLGREDRLSRLTYATRLVGRETELDKLKDLYQAAARGQGSLCLVGGEAGQGKSRLVSDLGHYVFEHGGEFVFGKCFRQENKTPYQPFSQALNAYLKRTESLHARGRQQRIDRMKTILGEQAEIICHLNPELREILGELPALVRLDPEKENRRFIMVCARFFLELGQTGKPLVLHLDDLQWSDEGSLGLLEEILEDIFSAPLLVLCTFRDKEIGAQHRLTQIIEHAQQKQLPLETVQLDSLRQPDVEQLVGELLGTEDDPVGDIALYVHRKSIGNVLYAIEIIRQLVEEKVLEFSKAHWKFKKDLLDKIAIPPNMLEAIQKRIDLLQPEHAQILTMAALIGYRFEMDTLYALSEYPQERVIQCIDEAIGFQLLEKGSQAGSIVFVHDRIHDAFYRRVGDVRRRQLHARIGRVIERLQPEKTGDVLFKLAHQYYEAGDRDNCLNFALPAAEQAQMNYANEEAIKYYSIASDIIEAKGLAGSADWVRAKEGLSDVYATIGQNDTAIRIAEELLGVKNTRLEKARLYRRIGLNYLRKSDYPNAEANLARGLQLLGKRLPRGNAAVIIGIGGQLVLHILHCLLPFVYSHKRSKKVSPKNKEIARLYESCHLAYVLGFYTKFFYVTLKMMNFGQARLGKSRELAGALMSYAMACAGITWFRRSLKYHRIALDIKNELADRRGIAESMRWLGFTHLLMCEYDKAVQYFQNARERFLAMGDLWELMYVLLGINGLHYMRTDLDLRDEAVRSMLAVSSKIKNAEGMGLSMESMGGSFLIRGDYEATEEWLKKAEQVSKEGQAWMPYCMCHGIWSQLLLDKGDAEGAAWHADFACQTEREYNLLKPAVAILYVFRVEAHVACFKEKAHSMSPAEKKLELKKIKAMVKEMVSQNRFRVFFQGIALRARAEFEYISGRPNKAQRLYLASINNLKSVERHYELAKTYFQYGCFLKDRSSEEDARKQWYQALNLFRQVGAPRHEKRTTALIGIDDAGMPATRDLFDNRRLESLLTVSRDISSHLDISRLLQSIIARAVEVTGAQRGYLFILDEQNQQLELKIQHNVAEDERAAFEISKSIVNQAFENAETVITTNARQNQDFSQHLSVVNYDLKSVLCVPIRHIEKTLGVCYLDNPLMSGVFAREDADLLEALMAQAAICIENARAYEEIRLLNRRLEKEREEIKGENIQLKKLVRLNAEHIKSFGDVKIVTQDRSMLKLIDSADRYAQTTANVLITGESGVGKEIFAHLIHHNSPHRNKPFVKVNCSAIPDTLFESEFFGYEKGAFSGAVKMKKGKFELAHEGTLFLDEVAEFPAAQQAKLLRILEDREVTRVGGQAPIGVDVKVISATNKDLAKLVEENRFREDLYFRLNVLNLYIPALSSRQDDISVLASYFLSQIANLEGGQEKYFDDSALIYLKNLKLPGNVRELKNLIHRTYLSTENDVVARKDIEACYRHEACEMPEEQAVFENNRYPAEPIADHTDGLFEESMPFRKFKELFETQYLTTQLKKHNYNVSRTAKSLKLQPSALFRKLKSMNIDVHKSSP
jgi:transcriptional regulator with GAF, ATPase, and Fis domain/serine/threonine protein kinase